jgi:hypothetical protein
MPTDPTLTDPAVVTLYNTRAGDTWAGIPVIGPVLAQGEDPEEPPAPMSAALVSARLHFTRAGAREPAIRIGTGPDDDAPLTIVDADTWEMTVPPVPPSVWTLAPGSYRGDLETTDADGTVRTLYRLVLTVTGDETR